MFRGPKKFKENNSSTRRWCHRAPVNEPCGEKKKSTLSLEAARANARKIDWENYTPPQPEFTGTRTIENQSLRELARYIDWTPFFHSWETNVDVYLILLGSLQP